MVFKTSGQKLGPNYQKISDTLLVFRTETTEDFGVFFVYNGETSPGGPTVLSFSLRVKGSPYLYYQ